jgi:hypothetical protein
MELPPIAPYRELVTLAFLTLVTRRNPTMDAVGGLAMAVMDQLENFVPLQTTFDFSSLQSLVNRLAPAFTVHDNYLWMLECDSSPLLDALFSMAYYLATAKRRESMMHHYKGLQDIDRFNISVVGMAVDVIQVARFINRYQPARVLCAISNLTSNLSMSSIIRTPDT